MKKLLITIITGVIGLTVSPTVTDAAPRNNNYQPNNYRSSYSSNGYATYLKKVFTGYDRYNRPTYRYIRVPVSNYCRSNVRSSNRYTTRYGNSRRSR